VTVNDSKKKAASDFKKELFRSLQLDSWPTYDDWKWLKNARMLDAQCKRKGRKLKQRECKEMGLNQEWDRQNLNSKVMEKWERRTELKDEVLLEVKKLAKSIRSWYYPYEEKKPKASIVQSVKHFLRRSKIIVAGVGSGYGSCHPVRSNAFVPIFNCRGCAVCVRFLLRYWRLCYYVFILLPYRLANVVSASSK
jgi:hypothetical protein